MPRQKTYLSVDETAILRTALRLRAEYFANAFFRLGDRLSHGLRALALWVRREAAEHRVLTHKTGVAALDERLLRDIGLCRNENRLLDHRGPAANDRIRSEESKQAA